MTMKKTAAAVLSLTLLCTVFAVPVSAHGHGGRCHGRSKTTVVATTYCNGSGYMACTLEGCETNGLHEHDGAYYCNNHYNNHGRGYCHH